MATFKPGKVQRHDPAALFNADGETYATVWQMRRIRAWNLMALSDTRKGFETMIARNRWSARLDEQVANDYRMGGR